MKKRTINLSLRIIGLIVILLAVVFTFLALEIASRIKDGIFEEQSHSVLQSAAQIEELLEFAMESISHETYLFAQEEEVHLAIEHNDQEELNYSVRHLHSEEEFFDAAFFTDEDGHILAHSVDNSLVGDSMASRDFYKALAFDHAETFLAETGEISTVTGNPVLTVAAPIVSEAGVLEAILVLEINLDKFMDHFVDNHKYGQQGYPYIIDTDGNVLAHPTQNLVTSNFIEYDFTQEMINSPEREGYVHYLWDGLWKYAFFVKMDNQPWIVAASIYDDDLLSIALQLRRFVIIMAVISVGSLVVLLILFIFFFVTRPINKISHSVSSGAENLEGASYQISSSSQELSSFSAELAASVEEISSSIEQLQAVVELNTKNINQSELMMKETNQGAQTVSEKMQDLKEALNEINGNSKQIVKIIKVIEDIAFQTNILALNAAVEAARAGDAGRGFAVVADQVKDLAQKSAGAASETAQLIERAIESVSKGEELGEHVLDIQLKSGEMSQKVATLLDEVNRSSQEQMRGINQITAAITQTNQGVQQSAASSEETAAASEELLSQAEELNSVVDQLNLLIKGKIEERTVEKKNTRKDQGTSKSQEVTRDHTPQLSAAPQDGTAAQEEPRSEDVIPFDDDEDGFQNF